MLDYKGLNFLWNFFRLENLRWRMVNDIYKQYFWAHCTDDNPKAKKFISHCTHIYLWFLNFLCITGNCMKASVLWCFENISKYLKLKAWYMIFCCVLNKITNLGYFELSIFFFLQILSCFRNLSNFRQSWCRNPLLLSVTYFCTHH